MTPCIAEILQGHYPPLMLTQDVGEAIYTVMQLKSLCSGQQKLATALEFFQNNRSDSFGVKPPLY